MADVTEDAAAELYAMPPEGFTAARAARIDAARRSGDRAGASAIGRLAKPTAAASLVNRLVREQPDLVHAVLQIGADLRRAQEELDAARLKSLGADRRDRVSEATEAAAAIGEAAGRRPGRPVLDEVAATLTAAVVDEDAGAAVASGRLIRALPADGLEGVAPDEVVALPGAPAALDPRSEKPATTARRATAAARTDAAPDDAKRRAERRDAERAVADAERTHDRAARRQRDAEDDLADTERRREEAEAKAEELRSRLADLRQRLDAAEDDLRRLDREVHDRRADERAARRGVEDAEDELARARERLDALPS